MTKAMSKAIADSCIKGIVCERKFSWYVDCHSVHEKTFAYLVIQLCIFWKEITQENVHKCTEICEIHKLFLSQTIPDIATV